MNLKDFLCNIEENLYKLRFIQTNDKDLEYVIRSVLSGRSIFESLAKYDSFGILIEGSILSIKLLGNVMSMDSKFKKHFITNMFYPIFLNVCLIVQFIFLHLFINITINVIILVISITFNIIISCFVFYRIFKRIVFIQKLFLWIHVIKGEISVNCLEKLNINITNYSTIEEMSFDHFKCTDFNDLLLTYEREQLSIFQDFSHSVKIITGVSIMIIGINLAFMTISMTF